MNEEARKELRKLFGEWWQNGKLSYLYKPEDLESVLAILTKATEANDDTKRLDWLERGRSAKVASPWDFVDEHGRITRATIDQWRTETRAAPASSGQQDWRLISTLDRTKMQFVLTYEDGEMRLYLWNPRGFWEHTNPCGARVSEHFNPTHWMVLPDAPTQPQKERTGEKLSELNKEHGVEYPKCEGCGDSIPGIIITETGLCHEMCCKDVPTPSAAEKPDIWDALGRVRNELAITEEKDSGFSKDLKIICDWAEKAASCHSGQAVDRDEKWECPECGHRMTERESQLYRGCPTGTHFVQHRRVSPNEQPMWQAVDRQRVSAVEAATKLVREWYGISKDILIPDGCSGEVQGLFDKACDHFNAALAAVAASDLFYRQEYDRLQRELVAERADHAETQRDLQKMEEIHYSCNQRIADLEQQLAAERQRREQAEEERG